ncbi:MAG: Asp-tRNA(Asn)/Glu-tRNA(Gln) amidotransferase subunit GatA [Candidatus Zixiibacteriota bacterium]|nr:MAG: Asp-tRNA(Asn)/Glu-tRNA(Gln) amidotransferase subunit GatA [candidate division Zixibacteria bacterium]
MAGLRDIQDHLRDGRIRVEDLVAESLERIARSAPLNAVVYTRPDDTLEAARRVDERLRGGDLPPLAGMTVVLKDNIAQDGWPLTCASRILGDFVSPYDATATARLKAAGAVIVGRGNMDEFAMGSSTEHSRFGPARNPLDPERVTGGSSGGSAAAVAADLCRAALGSETGGSVRQPAAFCGVYGLKPTYGRVSRFGLVAFASSLDQIGPLARSVEDLAAVFRAIAGKDPRDETSEDRPLPVDDFGLSVRGLRVGLPGEYFLPGLDPEVAAALEMVKRQLQEGGAELVDVSLPHTRYAIPVYYIVANAEASSNLARYDGVRYGLRAPEAESLEELYVRTRSLGFGDEVKRRIMLGTYALSAGYYEAYYSRALKVRRLVRQDFLDAFQTVDLLLTPTTPTPAFRLGEKMADPLAMYLSDVFTAPANLAGIPGLSVPAGRTASGLPLAAQFLAPDFGEEVLFRVGKYLETVNESA